MMNLPLGRLLPGDRIPDVRLYGSEGTGRRLHAEFAGTPLWIARLSSEEMGALLPQVPPGVTALCVGVEVNPAPVSGWASFRADTQWLDLFAQDQLWQADANLRIQSGHPLPMQSLPKAPVSVEAKPQRDFAPVLHIPGVFEPELCEALISHMENDCAGGEASKVLVLEGGEQIPQLDPSIKQRRESTPRDSRLDGYMHDRVMRRALPEIARVFNFQVSHRDAFKLLAYPDGAGYFHAHRDNDTQDVAHRRFALSVNLNYGAYVGGEFRYPEFGPHCYAPETGGAIVFSCSLLHEVLPVRRGTRYAVTTFLY